MNLDSYILNSFFDKLNSMNANYCVMNNYENMPEIIPSDVDFAVDKKLFSQLDKLMIELAKEHEICITQKIWHGYHKCAFILSPLDIDSFFFLQLDFFVDFSGKGFPNLFPNTEMQKNKRVYKNFYIPSPEVEIPFLLQRRIFKCDIKDKHVNAIAKLYLQNPQSIDKSIKSVFGNEVGLKLIKFIKEENIEGFRSNYPIYRKSLRDISSANTSVMYRVRYIVWQGVRATYRLYYPTGLSIAFIGHNSPIKNELIRKFDNVISGSFHGLLLCNPSSYIEYVSSSVIKGYWAKVTKKKVIYNLNSQNIAWDKKLSRSWLKYIFPTPDVIINLNSLDKNVSNAYLLITENDMRATLGGVTYTSLSTQAKKTQKHLMNKVSPTTF